MSGIGRFPDTLVLAQEDWDLIERRNQLLVGALARRHPRTRFLFAEQPARTGKPLRLVAPNVWAFRPLRPLPDRFGTLARLNDRFEAAQLRRALRRLAIERTALWTQDPRAATLVDLLPVDRVAYDLTDDWIAFEQRPQRRESVAQRVRALGSRADVVFACSRHLEEQARTHGWDVEYVPNAVEPPARPAPATLDLPRPVLGYAGTLHDARLDVELLAEAAKLRPDWSFALLGPDLLSGESRTRLAALPNVHHLGVCAHRDVRSRLEAFDVCLIPHRVTEFTRSLDPLKLYEYLAAGRPVLSTPTGNAPELAEHVTEFSGARELVAAAERVLAAETSEHANARRQAVAGATWEARAEQIERALGVATEAPACDVTAVVVSYETRELLTEALGALAAQEGVTVETIVVDNGSTDRSPELVEERFPQARVIRLGRNEGFARANNIAFAEAGGEFVLLLNSDCFLAPQALAELVAAARRHPEAAVIGARLLNEDGSLQRSAWPFPRARRLLLEALLLHRPLRRLGLLEDFGVWAHDEERAVEFLTGACMLVRRAALAEVGGFDERFWFYGEEADLCRRLADRGWDVVLAPAASAVHLGGASSASSAERWRHFYRGQKRFLRKHGAPGSWVLARLALVIGSVLRARWQVVRVALDPRL